MRREPIELRAFGLKGNAVAEVHQRQYAVAWKAPTRYQLMALESDRHPSNLDMVKKAVFEDRGRRNDEGLRVFELIEIES